MYHVLLVALALSGKMDCQTVAPVPNTTSAVSGDVSGGLTMFKGILGGNRVPPLEGNFRAKALYAQRDVLSKFPNADKLALRQQELSFVCQLLNGDPNMKTERKVQLMQSVGEGLAAPPPTPRPHQKSKSGSGSPSQHSSTNDTYSGSVHVGGNNYGPLSVTNITKASIGNLPERSSALANRILEDLWAHGWAEGHTPPGRWVGTSIHYPPSTATEACKTWIASRSSIFFHHFYNQVLQIQRDYASLQVRDDLLDQKLKQIEDARSSHAERGTHSNPVPTIDPSDEESIAERLISLAKQFSGSEMKLDATESSAPVASLPRELQMLYQEHTEIEVNEDPHYSEG